MFSPVVERIPSIVCFQLNTLLVKHKIEGGCKAETFPPPLAGSKFPYYNDIKVKNKSGNKENHTRTETDTRETRDRQHTHTLHTVVFFLYLFCGVCSLSVCTKKPRTVHELEPRARRVLLPIWKVRGPPIGHPRRP